MDFIDVLGIVADLRDTGNTLDGTAQWQGHGSEFCAHLQVLLHEERGRGSVTNRGP